MSSVSSIAVGHAAAMPERHAHTGTSSQEAPAERDHGPAAVVSVSGEAGAKAGSVDEELTPEQKKQVEELRARDREVRAHEQAHKAAAGGLGASAPQYEMQTGPDGRQYAVGGHVNISVSAGRTPDETIAKAARIRAAATAPAEPSAQDMAVAARASQMEAQARAEKAKQQSPGNDSDEAATAQTDPEGGPKADRADPAEVSFREGGVDGGHAHPNEGCSRCAGGIKAYGG